MGFRSKEKTIKMRFFLFCRFFPIQNKSPLNLFDSSASTAQMCIPPVDELFMFTYIFITNIKSADIAYLSIDNTQFAMITIINTGINKFKERWKENLDLAPMIDQFFEKRSGQFSRADFIIKNAYG